MRAAVRRQLEAMPDRFVRCHAQGHAWDEIDETMLRRDLIPRRKQITGGDRWIFRCIRCRSTKQEVVAWSGAVILRSYRYTRGYILVGVGHGRATWRAELLRRRRGHRIDRRRAA